MYINEYDWFINKYKGKNLKLYINPMVLFENTVTSLSQKTKKTNNMQDKSDMNSLNITYMYNN